MEQRQITVTNAKLKQKCICNLKTEGRELKDREEKEMVGRNLGQNVKHDDHSPST